MNTYTATRVEPTIERKTGALLLDPTPIAAPAVVYDTDTGEPVVAVARFPDWLLAGYRAALLAYPVENVSRMSGTRNDCTAFGYLARNDLLRRTGCQPCAAAFTATAAHQTICDAAEPLAGLLAEVLPERAAADRERAACILDEWKLGGWWTSGVVNFTSPLPYHTDANNLPCWSAMTVIRRGVRGGHLHLPDYDLVLGCRDGDVIFFAGWGLMHGVTPMTVKPGGYRITAVYYTVAKMQGCQPFDAELAARGKRRTDAEATMVERQRASGMLKVPAIGKAIT